MSTKAIQALRSKVKTLQAEVDHYRSQPDGRNAAAYPDLLGQLLKAQDALIRLEDPATAAFLDARACGSL